MYQIISLASLAVIDFSDILLSLTVHQFSFSAFSTVLPQLKTKHNSKASTVT
jgi:hypothetical protein